MITVLRRSRLAVSLLSTMTAWVALWALKGISSDPEFLGTVLAIGLAICVVGCGLRAMGAPLIAVVAGQGLIAEVGTFRALAGTWLPTPDARTIFGQALSDAADAAGRYAPPVPGTVVAPLLIVVGVATIAIVEVIAASLGKTALAGLPILAVVVVGGSLTDSGVGVLHFVMIAVGYLAMVAAGRTSELSLWSGRNRTEVLTASTSGGGLWLVGAGAVVVALLAAPLVPTASFTLFGGNGPGGNSNDSLRLTNPVVDIQASLNRGEDVPLIQVDTDSISPSYLRVAVLTRLNSMTWSTGERDIPKSNQASGPMPTDDAIDPDVLLPATDYTITTTSAFDSTWLPTYPELTSIEAGGDWRFDDSTMDFTGVGGQTAASMRYTMQARKVRALYSQLDQASPTANLDPSYTEAGSVPAEVADLAREVTKDATTPYQKAVALQTWFRSDAFRYDTRVSYAGPDGLARFLTEPISQGGRTGFCQQFASAFALMARELGMGSRVAVGFLRPLMVAADTYEFSSHDLHAWPEIWFNGFGWVRFEPTPSVRAPNVPSWTLATNTQPRVDPRESESSTPSTSPTPSARQSRDTTQTPTPATADDNTGAGLSTGWLIGGAAALAIAALIGLPRLVRTRRRARRSMTDPNQVWAELHDACIDLGSGWPDDVSPRTTARLLMTRLSTSEQTDALARINDAVERRRYASSYRGPDLSDDLTVVVDALAETSAVPRWRRTWLPASVLVRRGPNRTSSSDAITQDELVG